jgi:hypothetical protein
MWRICESNGQALTDPMPPLNDRQFSTAVAAAGLKLPLKLRPVLGDGRPIIRWDLLNQGADPSGGGAFSALYPTLTRPPGQRPRAKHCVWP